ncbi:polysaccharide deacetylase family protein [Methanogenium organophilum]|uniref:Polysaccharide deacetylase n=1 Tax=Methanogenium organophilum TaxID=2199 RepID=A0A9X9T8I9_METOG|nr:hypothetical protein [Methanogenium organophilum]WAI01212.1 hypothetical protein OU421_12485 [Methanogenium organophilum]
MDIIIVVHTEFGFVHNHEIIYNKMATEGVSKGVPNLVKIANKYEAKITFAVMPEVAKSFPKDINHEIGLHIHAGWEEFRSGEFTYHVGDRYLRDHCNQSSSSTVLRGYPYNEQLDMIQTGIDYLYDIFEEKPTTFVAGRWSIDNNTVKALTKTRMERDCSAPAHAKSSYYDWSKLPRICMPYHPDEYDYQKRGNDPLLIIPISQMFPKGIVSPEIVPLVGLSWMKACFIEYINQNIPIFHICLHSPCMTDPFFISVMDEFLHFISTYHDIHFKFASEIQEYNPVNPSTSFSPYAPKIFETVAHIIQKSIYGW